MSLLEQQNALAKLLTDPEMRKRLLTEPAAVGREFDLQPDEMEDLLEVAESSLGIFADSLVNKRLNEVSKLLPITRRATTEQFRQLFHEFAPTYIPGSVKKHFEDAMAFCRFIEGQDLPDMVRDAARLERARLLFFHEERRFACCRLRYRFEGHDGSPGRRQLGYLAVWFRVGRRVFHFYV